MIVTLCGSARFEPEFHRWNKELTLAGYVVFSLATFPSVEGSKDWYTMEQKKRLDCTYREKIALSDIIVVIDNKWDGTGFYRGAGLLEELSLAYALNKRVYATSCRQELALLLFADRS